MGSIVVVPRLSNKAHSVVIFPDQGSKSWDLPRPGIKVVSPTLAGGFFTTELPGKPNLVTFNEFFLGQPLPARLDKKETSMPGTGCNSSILKRGGILDLRRYCTSSRQEMAGLCQTLLPAVSWHPSTGISALCSFTFQSFRVLIFGLFLF